MTYTLTAGSGVTRDADGAQIPDAAGNVDWQAYQAWLAAGNTPSPVPAVAAAPAQFTFLQFIALFTSAEQTTIVGSTDTNVRLFLLMAAGAAFVSLSDQRTVGGLNYLVSQGMLTQDRATAIMASPAPTD